MQPAKKLSFKLENNSKQKKLERECPISLLQKRFDSMASYVWVFRFLSSIKHNPTQCDTIGHIWTHLGTGPANDSKPKL